MGNSPATLTITIVWDERYKEWRVTTVTRVGRGVVSAHALADSHEPIEPADALNILSDIVRRLEARLPFAP